MATKKQKMAQRKALAVRRCLIKKYGKKSKKTGKKVGPKKPTLKQKANCGSKSAKARLSKRKR